MKSRITSLADPRRSLGWKSRERMLPLMSRASTMSMPWPSISSVRWALRGPAAPRPAGPGPHAEPAATAAPGAPARPADSGPTAAPMRGWRRAAGSASPAQAPPRAAAPAAAAGAAARGAPVHHAPHLPSRPQVASPRPAPGRLAGLQFGRRHRRSGPGAMRTAATAASRSAARSRHQPAGTPAGGVAAPSRSPAAARSDRPRVGPWPRRRQAATISRRGHLPAGDAEAAGARSAARSPPPGRPGTRRSSPRASSSSSRSRQRRRRAEPGRRRHGPVGRQRPRGPRRRRQSSRASSSTRPAGPPAPATASTHASLAACGARTGAVCVPSVPAAAHRDHPRDRGVRLHAEGIDPIDAHRHRQVVRARRRRPAGGAPASVRRHRASRAGRGCPPAPPRRPRPPARPRRRR